MVLSCVPSAYRTLFVHRAPLLYTLKSAVGKPIRGVNAVHNEWPTKTLEKLANSDCTEKRTTARSLKENTTDLPHRIFCRLVCTYSDPGSGAVIGHKPL